MSGEEGTGPGAPRGPGDRPGSRNATPVVDPVAVRTQRKGIWQYSWQALLVIIGVLAVGAWLGFKHGLGGGASPAQGSLGPSHTAMLFFLLGTAVIIWGARVWLGRIDGHVLLRADERLQNKDALVIGTFFTVVMLLAFCVTGAAAATQFEERAPAAVLLSLGWALASASVGGAFGFLLGHPRRLAGDEKGKEERSTLGGLLRTGLDDMVDWLVKGLTTVLLVNSTWILGHIDTLSATFANGLIIAPSQTELAAAKAFAQPVIVFFTIFGALAACLVTRTYLTGALGRADRTTTGAFNRVGLDLGEVLMLQAAQRSLTTHKVELSAEIRKVAEKLAGLSVTDLRAPKEFGMWAKANSMLGKISQALEGYERAVRQTECDPALLLDYGVALHMAGKNAEALARLEQAHEHLSKATPEITRKNVVKSLTFQLLYEPSGFDRVIQLIKDYDQSRTIDSGGLRVNEACAWGQKFKAEADKRNLLVRKDKDTFFKPFKLNLDKPIGEWPTPLQEAYQGALAALKRVIEHDSRWKERLRLLLQSQHPGKQQEPEMNDLEVFERFDEFRLELDLPPYADAPADAQPAGEPASAAPRSSGPAGQETSVPGSAHVAHETNPVQPTETESSPPSAQS